MTPRSFTWYNGVALAAALLFALFPLFWLVSTSFKPWVDYNVVPPIWITDTPTLRAYHDVFYPYVSLIGFPQESSWRSFISSSIVSVVATFFSVIIGLMAAIGIARYRVGGSFIPFQILAFRMVPPVAVAIPFGILGTVVGVTLAPLLLTIIYVAYTVPLSTWMLKSFIEQVPHEIEDAAMMDGMSRWQAHWHITVPLIKGGIAATTFFIFILNWSEGAIALALAQGKWVTIPVQLTDKIDSPHVQVALAVLAALPLVVIGLSIHKHLSRGFTFGAIKR